MHELEPGTKALWVLLGAIGGLAKVLVQLLKQTKLPSLLNIIWLITANMFVSGFSGFMGAVIASQISSDDNMHVVAAGIAGYMGVAALDLFSSWFQKRIK